MQNKIQNGLYGHKFINLSNFEKNQISNLSNFENFFEKNQNGMKYIEISRDTQIDSTSVLDFLTKTTQSISNSNFHSINKKTQFKTQNE